MTADPDEQEAAVAYRQALETVALLVLRDRCPPDRDLATWYAQPVDGQVAADPVMLQAVVRTMPVRMRQPPGTALLGPFVVTGEVWRDVAARYERSGVFPPDRVVLVAGHTYPKGQTDPATPAQP